MWLKKEKKYQRKGLQDAVRVKKLEAFKML